MSLPFRRPLLVATGLACLAACAATLAAEETVKEERGTQFIRLSRGETEQPVALQTAIVHYVPSDPARGDVSIDLVAAVHVADAAYYERLNKEFENYDVVLYELVAPEGTRVPKGEQEASNPLAALQLGMGKMLKLEHQLESIDYDRDNFVHADMSPEEFAESMQSRGENFWSMALRMLQENGAGQGRQQDLGGLLSAIASGDSLALKRLLAEQFQDLEGAMAMIEGPNGSTIISERNKVALKALGEQLIDGKQSIAIFYGGGHLPDMERRLRSVFGFEPQDARWLVAWDMHGDTGKKPRRPNGP